MPLRSVGFSELQARRFPLDDCLPNPCSMLKMGLFSGFGLRVRFEVCFRIPNPGSSYRSGDKNWNCCACVCTFRNMILRPVVLHHLIGAGHVCVPVLGNCRRSLRRHRPCSSRVTNYLDRFRSRRRRSYRSRNSPRSRLSKLDLAKGSKARRMRNTGASPDMGLETAKLLANAARTVSTMRDPAGDSPAHRSNSS
jgi:hypothetical protein